MGLLSLQRRRRYQGLSVGFALTLIALVVLCPNLHSDCVARSHQACQDSACVFLTWGGMVAALIIHAWLVWTALFIWSRDEPRRLFRPPRRRLLSFSSLST
jgi:hypothetical protein